MNFLILQIRVSVQVQPVISYYSFVINHIYFLVNKDLYLEKYLQLKYMIGWIHQYLII